MVFRNKKSGTTSAESLEDDYFTGAVSPKDVDISYR